MKKNVIILRSVPGAGKSSIASLYKGAIICCADDWFYKEYGEYKWSVTDIRKAHTWCLEKFKNAIDESEEIVIVANTNTKEKDWKQYEEYAKMNNYLVHFLIVENRHGNENLHNVPKDTLNKMKNNILDNIKLF